MIAYRPLLLIRSGLPWLMCFSIGCMAEMTIVDLTADDDDVGDDDDTADDDTADDDSADDDVPDYSAWNGGYAYHVDFTTEAEEWMDAVDCDATYDQTGPNVTEFTSDLCPACDHIYELLHAPSPPEVTLACVDQLGWSGDPYTRLYGIQFTGETEFILWRNFSDPENELTEYGTGEIVGAAFTYTLEDSDNWWYYATADGAGTFGP